MDISFSLQGFWIPLIQIIIVNIMVSGDNAVVIAIAARSLPPNQQKKAILWGSAAAIVMLVLLTIFAVALLQYPYLKLIGAVALLWIGVQLLSSDDDEPDVASPDHLLSAIKTILVADLIMSLDNVLGVAAAAKGSVILLVLGLAISIPVVIFGATLLIKVMTRFPIIVTIGAMLLGWVAGEMAVDDPAVLDWVEHSMPILASIVPAAGAVLVLVVGKYLARKNSQEQAAS